VRLLRFAAVAGDTARAGGLTATDPVWWRCRPPPARCLFLAAAAEAEHDVAALAEARARARQREPRLA
jgi:hypothetical protein